VQPCRHQLPRMIGASKPSEGVEKHRLGLGVEKHRLVAGLRSVCAGRLPPLQGGRVHPPHLTAAAAGQRLSRPTPRRLPRARPTVQLHACLLYA
jgi:hypothetical protein